MDTIEHLPDIIPAAFPVIDLQVFKRDEDILTHLVRIIQPFPDLIQIFKGKGLNNRQKAYLCAYYRTGCNNSAASKLVGVYSHYKWMGDDPQYNGVVDEINEIVVDAVELKLFQHIEGGSLRAIEIFLRNKGRKRGYGNELKVDNNFNFNTNITNMLQAARARVTELNTKDEPITS